MRTLVGAIGYRNLRDHSAAFDVLERLSRETVGSQVVLEDISYNPIAVVQWLEALPDGARFERVILVSAVERPGRAGGSVSTYRWNRVVPSDDVVQRAVTEAVTGIISLDNTVTIGGYFGVWPPSLTIVEIQPVEHEFGSELSPVVSRAVPSVATFIREAATERETIP